VSRSAATQAPFAALGILLFSVASATNAGGWIAILIAVGALVLLVYSILYLLRHR
jgi:hypothetical protein